MPHFTNFNMIIIIIYYSTYPISYILKYISHLSLFFIFLEQFGSCSPKLHSSCTQHRPHQSTANPKSRTNEISLSKSKHPHLHPIHPKLSTQQSIKGGDEKEGI